MTDPTVSALAEFSRRKPRERRLVCPKCGGRVWLADGRYYCGTSCHDSCGFVTSTLRDIARGEEIR